MSSGTLSVRETPTWIKLASRAPVLIHSGPTGNQNCFLVKSKKNGSPQFSRDPLNLRNLNSRKVWHI